MFEKAKTDINGQIIAYNQKNQLVSNIQKHANILFSSGAISILLNLYECYKSIET